MRRAALLAAALAASPAAAEVKSAGPGGFELSWTVIVKASPTAAWALLVRPAEWWNAEHSWSGRAANLSLEPQAGGCFCEAVPPGGSVEHGRVLAARPGAALVLEAPLGPLQSLAVSARLSWTLKATPGGTEIAQVYAVGGYMPMGGDKLAPLVDQVLADQLARLKARIER
jgi:uncharacterized protein YndB with AHSA1/START domain